MATVIVHLLMFTVMVLLGQALRPTLMAVVTTLQQRIITTAMEISRVRQSLIAMVAIKQKPHILIST